MKKILLLSCAILSLFACKKGSGNNAQDASLSAITVYNPLAHSLNIQQFQFSNGLLATYSDKTIDTFSIGVNWESRTYVFNYGVANNLPNSVTFLDTAQEDGSVNATQQQSISLVYDNNNRLILDSVVGTYSGEPEPKWFYDYSADSVIFSFSPAPGTRPGNPDGFLVETGGNLGAADGWTYSYSSVANPLKNNSLAKTFAPFFYAGLIGVYIQSNALPVDFISDNLPSGYVDVNGNSTTFVWTKDSKGRVSGGTANNMYWYASAINGPVTITYTYQ